MDTRRCSRCGQALPVERFGKNSRSADGLMTACRECVNTDLRAYRARDGRAAANRHSRDWARRNREKVAAAQRAWAKRNRERRRQYFRDRAQDPEFRARRNALARARRAANPTKARQRDARYKRANRERITAQQRARWRKLHPPKPVASLAERFEARVVRGAPGECWRWIGSRADGYARIQSAEGKPLAAGRVAWELFVRPLAADEVILRICGDRACTRPDPGHAEVVSRAERGRRNMKIGVPSG